MIFYFLCFVAGFAIGFFAFSFTKEPVPMSPKDIQADYVNRISKIKRDL